MKLLTFEFEGDPQKYAVGGQEFIIAALARDGEFAWQGPAVHVAFETHYALGQGFAGFGDSPASAVTSLLRLIAAKKGEEIRKEVREKERDVKLAEQKKNAAVQACYNLIEGPQRVLTGDALYNALADLYDIAQGQKEDA